MNNRDKLETVETSAWFLRMSSQTEQWSHQLQMGAIKQIEYLV